MKNLYFLLSLFMIFSAGNLTATIYTVDNSATGAAQFTSIQTAVNAASSGDTILVQPSGVSYGNVNINKRLVFIGGGFAPHNGTIPATTLGTVNLDNTAAISTTIPFEFTGFDIIALSHNGPGILLNVVFRRCKIANHSNASSIKQSLFEGCLFTPNTSLTILPFAWEDVVFRNCVFINTNAGFGVGFSFGNAVSGHFEHCIFYGRATSMNTFNLFTSATSVIMTFTNCIFDGRISMSNASNISFSHCMLDSTLGSDHATKLAFMNTNTQNPNSNILGDPNFTMFSPPEAFVSSTRFFLGTGSAAIGTGLAGEDMGVHGGLATYSYGGMPALPVISQAQVVSNPTPADQTIKVFINAHIEQ